MESNCGNHEGAGFTARRGAAFSICIVASFFTLPAFGAALQVLLGPVRAQDSSWMAVVVWIAAFLIGGAIAGDALVGPRGRLPFSTAFVIFPVGAAVVVGQSISFHDYSWRQYEHVLDFGLFNTAYPATFAAVAWLGTIILTRRSGLAWSAAASCGLSGVAGGVVFSLATSFLPLRGRIEVVSFVISLAIPAFLSARNLSAIRAKSVR